MSLPGVGNYGYVRLNNISSIYNDQLKSSVAEALNGQHHAKNGPKQHATLFDMYHKGNLLRCKVQGFSNKKLYLTIEPSQVNAGLSYASLETDMVDMSSDLVTIYLKQVAICILGRPYPYPFPSEYVPG